jgi:hypothetical protein
MSLARIRMLHMYAGVFFAPTIIFFAFSGVMQVFKLHEAYRATPGAPGDWIAWMSQVHKEAALIPPKAAPAKAPDSAPSPPREERSSPFKWFAALMGVSLIGASLAGLWIAYGYPKRRRAFFITLVSGVVLPIVLLQLGAPT